MLLIKNLNPNISKDMLFLGKNCRNSLYIALYYIGLKSALHYYIDWKVGFIRINIGFV